MPHKRPGTRQQAGAIDGLMLGPNNLLDDSIADSIEMQPVVLPGFPDDARAELGIPLDSYLFKLTLDFKSVRDAPRDWQGYTWELVGTIPLPESTFERNRFALPVFAGYGAPDSAIVVWRRRVYWEEPPGVYVEVRWHPTMGETHAMVWPSHVPLNTVHEYMANGLKLLRELERRGRRPGPDGFDDAQEFEATLVHLIQAAHAKGQGTKQERIAAMLKPELDSRRGDIGSAASVDVHLASTIRLIRKHISCPWRDLVKKALHTP
jgi:hypothetical protein